MATPAPPSPAIDGAFSFFTVLYVTTLTLIVLWAQSEYIKSRDVAVLQNEIRSTNRTLFNLKNKKNLSPRDPAMEDMLRNGKLHAAVESRQT